MQKKLLSRPTVPLGPFQEVLELPCWGPGRGACNVTGASSPRFPFWRKIGVSDPPLYLCLSYHPLEAFTGASRPRTVDHSHEPASFFQRAIHLLCCAQRGKAALVAHRGTSFGDGRMEAIHGNQPRSDRTKGSFLAAVEMEISIQIDQRNLETERDFWLKAPYDDGVTFLRTRAGTLPPSPYRISRPDGSQFANNDFYPSVRPPPREGRGKRSNPGIETKSGERHVGRAYEEVLASGRRKRRRGGLASLWPELGRSPHTLPGQQPWSRNAGVGSHSGGGHRGGHRSGGNYCGPVGGLRPSYGHILRFRFSDCDETDGT